MKTISKTKNKSSSNSHLSKPFFNKNKEGSSFSNSKNTETPFFTASNIQAKLTIGAPGDKYEQEADTMAEKVVQNLGSSNPSSVVQRQCNDCNDEDKIQRKGIVDFKISKKHSNENSGHLNSNDNSNIERQLQSSKGGGHTLDKQTQQNMEQGFGADFSNVKIHTGNNAVQMSQDLGAQAFTNGSDIYFNEGKYNPSTKTGNKLLAHELTHVVQQGGATRLSPSKKAQKNSEKVSHDSSNYNLIINRLPENFIARAASPKEISVVDKGIGAIGYKLGSIVSDTHVRYRYGLKFKVDGDIKDADLGTRISSLMEDWSQSKVDYYVDIKKKTKENYESATEAWTSNKEKFHVDYAKSDLIGAGAATKIVESGNTWVKVADGPGGPVADWATGALVRYTVIAWIKGTDGKELSLRFWASMWASREKPGDAFKVNHAITQNIPGKVTS